MGSLEQSTHDDANSAATVDTVAAFDVASLLGEIDTRAALIALTVAVDVTLLLNAEGRICEVYSTDASLLDNAGRQWIGKLWSATVTRESLPKVEALLRDAVNGSPTVWRQLNHPSVRGIDVPVSYAVRRLGTKGTLVAMGRDLRSNAALQQRLVEAQQSVERDYWRLRDAQSLYRVAMQLSSEATLVIDSGTHTVVEANAAANRLLAVSGAPLVGQVFPLGLDAESTKTVAAQLSKARVSSVVDEVHVRLMDGGRECFVACAYLRQEAGALLVVRLTPLGADDSARSALNRLIQVAPDCFVMTNLDGVVVAANSTFVELSQVPSEEEACGQRLDRWLGRTAVDFDVLLTNLRQYGSVRLFVTTLRGTQGNMAEVEVSAVTVNSGRDQFCGFSIRDIGRRLGGSAATAVAIERQQPRSLDQLTELVGRVPLKELVGESTDIIERLCIEAALELTQDNRAAAAEMLGLSRQSLYVKMRRYGLGNLPPDEGNARELVSH